MDTSNEIFIFIGVMLILLAASVQHMIPNPPATAVGVDLGTTFSCVAVFEDGEINVITNEAGSTITPSVVYVPQNGSFVVVGEHARATAARANGTLVYDAKRFIGKRWSPQLPAEATGLPFDVVPSMSAWGDQLRPTLRVHAGGQQLSFAPEEVGALIVKQAKVSSRAIFPISSCASHLWHAFFPTPHPLYPAPTLAFLPPQLRAAAAEHVGRAVDKAVIAVPVGFGGAQIRATKRAAELAGFEVLRVIHEPTAAAMAYGLHNTGAHSLTVMVYDMGGGTLDVSLLNLNNGIFEVMAAAGDNRLGGQDFSAAILGWILDKLAERLPERQPTRDPEVMRALREEAERVKVRTHFPPPSQTSCLSLAPPLDYMRYIHLGDRDPYPTHHHKRHAPL